MNWTIKYGSKIPKDLKKIDKPNRTRILDYLDETAELEDLRSRGKGLTGNLASLWRYRIGNYRAIVEIQDGELVILAIKIAHRSDVYLD